MAKLKCPKCKGLNIKIVNEDWWPENGPYKPVIWCTDCRFNINAPTLDEVIKLWAAYE